MLMEYFKSYIPILPLTLFINFYILKMDKILLLSFFLCKLLSGNNNLAESPSKYYDLLNWKLQIPGPKEIKNLGGYTSNYFYLAKDTSICFDLDASEKGTTKNAHFVRSELRHLLNWETNSKHFLSSKTKITCDLPNYQVTVMQIHGITRNNDDAPPLLRIALVNGDLYSYLKSDSTGYKTKKQLLTTNLYNQYFITLIKIENSTLSIIVNGKECSREELFYWNYLNYFKLGCYPQEKKGNFKIYVKSFSVS